MKELLVKLKGKAVSLMADCGKEVGKRENYYGIIEEVKDGFVTLNLNNPRFYLKKVHVKCDQVVSVWEYNKVAKTISTKEK
jgi:hypothetical protein